MQSQLFPLLSEYDPAGAGEGSLDPLGLYPIADALAEQLVPAVRERQKHPRFLTAMAVGAEICKKFEPDIIAYDGISPPWQVFEWYVVEGMVRTAKDPMDVVGVPGSDKARSAIKDNMPLSARRYLKSPSVFGFHGVYRVLAQNLDIVNNEMLGEAGYNLIKTWEKEQDLGGFVGDESGPGAEIRKQIFAAVQDGLKKGATARSASWKGWPFFLDHLGPYRCGPKEAEVIFKLLLESSSGFRKEVIEYLISGEGQKIWRKTESEREFHRALKKNGNKRLISLLEAIERYEEFSRILQDAFDDCLYTMTIKGVRISLKELAQLDFIKNAKEKIPELYKEVSDCLELFGKAQEFELKFSSLEEQGTVYDWVDRLFEHHFKVQREKPPYGKNPWFERIGDNHFIIRPGYRRDSGGLHDDSYLHFYRTNSLWSFLRDLRLV